MHLRCTRWFLLVLVVTAFAHGEGAGDDSPFAAMTLKDALARAGQGGKLVMIDFYTTWCGPCRMLDKTTWKDPAVVAWLRANTIPLRVDAEADRELADKYSPEGYPTILFLKADGTELDRMVGYVNAEEFLAEAAGIRSGKDAIARAQEKLKGKGENDPMARMEYARALNRKGRREEALKELLWCFDEGAKKSPSFFGVRLSFLLSDIAEMGSSYPPALTALRERREVVRSRILSGKAPYVAPIELKALNDVLHQSEDTLAVYDQLKRGHADSELLSSFRNSITEELLAAKRYAELYDKDSFDADIQQTIEMYKPSWATKLFTLKMPKEQREELEKTQQRLMVQKLGEHYQVLIGLRNLDEAGKLAEQTISLSDCAETYNTLAWNGYLTGAPVEANVAQGKKAYELTGGKVAAVIDTYARVLNACGRRGEAVSVVRQAKATLTSPSDQEILNRCLADFGGDRRELVYVLVGAAMMLALLLVVRRVRRKQVPSDHPVGTDAGEGREAR